MREFLFRAFVKDKQKIYNIKKIDFDYRIVWFEEENKATDTMRMFDQIELMQYTGLTDKNGKKVYEGDRVKVTYIEKRQYQGVPYDDEHCLTEEVFYSEENACFMLKVMCGDIPMYRPLHNFESLAKIKEIEVIGNIHDNPELLEGV